MVEWTYNFLYTNNLKVSLVELESQDKGLQLSLEVKFKLCMKDCLKLSRIQKKKRKPGNHLEESMCGCSSSFPYHVWLYAAMVAIWPPCTAVLLIFSPFGIENGHTTPFSPFPYDHMAFVHRFHFAGFFPLFCWFLSSWTS